ncbi:hypothetical protein [Nevskia sp.]|uniref:hypothetical protein n=1 Tax=Nevskia sp. TaxID=1929292 RepID=UPI0025E36301|nr:hypothetical protein [Nevskia sp.]
MLKKTSCALAIAAVLVTACGGGGSSGTDSSTGGGGSTPGGTTTPAPAAVAGPLDTVQTAVTDTVIAPLVTATAGTPLQGVLLCGNSIVTRNLLDIGDAIANGLASPSTLVSTAPAAAQGALTALVGNLSGLLGSLSGSVTCLGGSTGSTPVPTTNPLAGTPLAPIGDALLPVLTAAMQQLAAGTNGTLPQIGATQLATIVAQLATAYDSALTQLPPEALAAPVVGGTLVTVGNTLDQLVALTNLAATGASVPTLAAAFQTLAQNALNDVLTLVLPVDSLQGEAGAGAPTDVLATLQAAIASLTGGLGTSPTTPLPANPLGGTGFAALTGLVTQLTSLLPTGLTGSAGTSPLATATGPLQTLLSSLLAPLTGGGLPGGTTGGTTGGSTGGTTGGCLLAFLGLC